MTMAINVGQKSINMRCILMVFMTMFSLSILGEDKGKTDIPPVIHSKIGSSITTDGGELTIRLLTKKQNFDVSDVNTLDGNINSPKSANIHPNGKKMYINSLEGCATVVYSTQNYERLKVIKYSFNDSHQSLWGKPSALFPFTHYSKNVNIFAGKPVESTFSHKGRYLWIPFYRRTFDINAQDPSALAVIDTEQDTIVRLMETGPLPKMIACSPDGKTIAVTHWGNNTVGIIDASNANPMEWHYTDKIVIDYELQLNLSLDKPVNRDSDSGYCLRGTVFTPDGRYLLVGCMTGAYGIAVIDMQDRKYLGRVLGTMPNVRHILICDGWLYLSINKSGYVQRIRLNKFLNAARAMKGKTTVLKGWEQCKVPAGARTIELSPSGRYIFAACNIDSKLAVVDSKEMRLIGTIDVDSYPVGLAISTDGSRVIVTSQGRGENMGGNAVNIFAVEYSSEEKPLVREDSLMTDSAIVKGNITASTGSSLDIDDIILAICSKRGIAVISIVIIFITAIMVSIRLKKKKNEI